MTATLLLETAALLCLYAAMTAAYFGSPDRWPKDSPPPPGAARLATGLVAAFAGEALWLAIRADGWVAGLGLWSTGAMIAGVAAVSLASFRPWAARRSAVAAALAAALLPTVALAVR